MRTERGGRKGRRAHSARDYRVYPKTVRRTVVLCRGGPVWPPTPGQPHRVAPTTAPALSGYEWSQVGVFLLPPLYAQIYRRRGSRVRSAHHIAGAKTRCASAPYKL